MVHNGTIPRSEKSSTGMLFSLTVALFVGISSILFVFDFVPEAPKGVASDDNQPTTSTALYQQVPAIDEVVATAPERIVIPAIGVESQITAPESTNVDVLDRALLLGTVHYPGSGMLGENGNVLLFAHSSYLPVVKNKAFQAFNELGKLEMGDLVTVYSATHAFTYSVTSVKLAPADTVLITFTADEPILTLATCNTFGAKQDRWVVSARLVEREARTATP